MFEPSLAFISASWKASRSNGLKYVGPDNSTFDLAKLYNCIKCYGPKAYIQFGSPLRGKQWLVLFIYKLGNLGFAPKPNAGILLSLS